MPSVPRSRRNGRHTGTVLCIKPSVTGMRALVVENLLAVGGSRAGGATVSVPRHCPPPSTHSAMFAQAKRSAIFHQPQQINFFPSTDQQRTGRLTDVGGMCAYMSASCRLLVGLCGPVSIAWPHTGFLGDNNVASALQREQAAAAVSRREQSFVPPTLIYQSQTGRAPGVRRTATK